MAYYLLDALLRRHAAVNDTQILSLEVVATGGAFVAPLKLPTDLPWKTLIVRAWADAKTGSARGVLSIPVPPEKKK